MALFCIYAKSVYVKLQKEVMQYGELKRNRNED